MKNEEKKNYNESTVNDIIELEIKMIEKKKTKNSETVIRRACLGIGILYAMCTASAIFKENSTISEVTYGAMFTGLSLGIYFGRRKNINIFEEEYDNALLNYNSERDNLDNDQIELLEVRRKELGLSKKRKK